METANSVISFVDVETTGLDPDLHQIWEVAITRVDHQGRDESMSWFLPVDLSRADPVSLDIGQFYSRHPSQPDSHPKVGADGRTTSSLDRFAAQFARLTRNTHLAGMVVSFDEERLRKLLRANGQCPAWHYHIVDIEAMCAGRLGWNPPWDSTNLSKAMGVNPEDYERHTAAGDVAWGIDLYNAVMEGANPRQRVSVPSQ